MRARRGRQDLLTILFTDLEGSTAMTLRLGDARAPEIVVRTTRSSAAKCPRAPAQRSSTPAMGPWRRSTRRRDDGTTQLTYNRPPLYRFVNDAAPGDTNGDGVGGVWHAAKP